jgi:hypothetical protein
VALAARSSLVRPKKASDQSFENSPVLAYLPNNLLAVSAISLP